MKPYAVEDWTRHIEFTAIAMEFVSMVNTHCATAL